MLTSNLYYTKMILNWLLAGKFLVNGYMMRASGGNGEWSMVNECLLFKALENPLLGGQGWV